MTEFDSDIDRFIAKRKDDVQKPFPGILSHTMFSGSTQSGKSTLMKIWLDTVYNKVFDEIFYFNYTSDVDNFTEIFEVPEDNVFNDLDEDILEVVYEEIKQRFKYRDGNYLSLLIIDDMNKLLRRLKNFGRFLSSCRHYGITVWLGCQDLTNIDRDMRTQLYAYVVFPYSEPATLEMIAKNTIGKKLNEILEVVIDINETKDTRYGYLLLNKQFPRHYYYGLGKEVWEIEME